MKDTNFGLVILVSMCFFIVSMSLGVSSYPLQPEGNNEVPFPDANELAQAGKDPQPSLEEIR